MVSRHLYDVRRGEKYMVFYVFDISVHGVTHDSTVSIFFLGGSPEHDEGVFVGRFDLEEIHYLLENPRSLVRIHIR